MARPHNNAHSNGVETLAEETVVSSGEIPLSADHLWLLVRDFHATWHPAITSMEAQHDDRGGSIRAFTVEGEDTLYRERLTWFSDTDQTMAYTHLEGIAGVQDYNARLSVSSVANNQSTLTMTAELVAPTPRAAEIAAGTQSIFDDAISTIRTIANDQVGKSQVEETADSHHNDSIVSTEIRKIDGSPALAVSYRDSATTDSLCLFLHGIGGNKDNWQQQLAAVAPYTQAAALDLRGYGESELGDSQSTIEDYCDDILRVADSAGSNKLILAGLSYGAWIATSFAVRYPDRLSGLVLSGGCTGMSEASDKEREAFLRSREVPMSEGKTPADFAPDVLEVITGPNCPDAVRSELLASMQAIPSETYADALRCFTNPTQKFDFSSIFCPVLLMTGEADRLAPPGEIRQVAERIFKTASRPDVRFECLPGAGHVCNLEASGAYNAALIAYVQRIVQ